MFEGRPGDRPPFGLNEDACRAINTDGSLESALADLDQAGAIRITTAQIGA
jgi:hypothetical protein